MSTYKTVVSYGLTGGRDFTIPFEYLARKFIQVTLVGDGIRTLLTLNTDYRFSTKTQITTNQSWPVGQYREIEIRRFTSATDRLINFNDGSILRATDLNLSQIQTLHVAEEARDLTIDLMGLDSNGNFDARNHKIVNLSTGTNPKDAVNVEQMRIVEGSAGDSMRRAEAASVLAVTSRDISSVNAIQAVAAAATAVNSAHSAKTSEESCLDIQDKMAENWFYPPKNFVSGLGIISNKDTVLYLGSVYSASPSAIPFVTTLDFNPAQWILFSNLGRVELAQPTGASLVGYKLGTVNSALVALENKVAEVKSVKDFGATGDGITDDLPAFTAAKASGAPIMVTSGKYNLSGAIAGNFLQIGSGVSFLNNAPENRNIAFGVNTINHTKLTDLAVGNVAIGNNILSKLEGGYGNVAIGDSCLTVLTNAQNNTAVGWNVLRNTTTGYNNTAIGRNALMGNETGNENCAFGWASQQRSTVGENNSSYGRSTLEFNVSGSFNNVVGSTGLFNNISGSYNQTLGCSALWHNVSGSQNVAIGTDSLYRCLDSGNTAIGHNSGKGVLGQNNVIVGRNALQTTGSTGSFNIAIGNAAMGSGAVTGSQSVAVGQSAMLLATTGDFNTSIGPDTLGKLTTGTRNSALGASSLNFAIDGTAFNFDNCTGLGNGTRASGSNQVSLGNAATTTYVYGTVQNRSDIRDKTDVRNTVLGLEFIKGLRPVDGRWNMREDYIDEDGIQLVSDGSKKRERLHHWFIAQEVKALADSLGVDFGGFQDHSLTGGSDVMTLGYDEFIPPIVKAIQECHLMLLDIDKRLKQLEK